MTDNERIVGYERSPVDLLRTIVLAVTAIVLAGFARWARDVVIDLEGDLVRLFDFLTPPAERIVSGLLQIGVAFVVVAYLVVPIVTRRYRLFGYLVVANIVAAGLALVVSWWVDRQRPAALTEQIADRGGVGYDFPTVWAMAGLVASFVVLGPFVSRRYRRAGAVTLGVIVLVRLVVSVHLPADVFGAIALGAAAGAGVLFAFGRPDLRPVPAAIELSLRGSGLPLAALEAAAVNARGSTPYFGTLDDGSRIFAKVLGAGERSADLLFRAYRYARFKNVGDERPFSSLRRTVEHEALVSLLARDVGVRTPRLRALAEVGTDAYLLTYDLIDGRSLDRVDDSDVDDELLDRIWTQVAVLRRHRIAHRDLRRANLFVDIHGAPWLIDFGFSEVAVSDELLNADVAQLLAALAVKVGAARAVDSAIATLGPQALGGALPRLQPNALSGATRTALKQQPGLLEELQATVAERSGIDELTFEPIQRVKGKTIFTIAMLAAVMYFLLPQLADVPGIIGRIREADWAWVPGVIAMSALSYVGAGLSMLGAVAQRLRAFRTLIAQLASSFANKLAPAAVGGMALNVRYLQKAGVDPAMAASGVGLNSVGGFVMHVSLLIAFTIWAGRSAFGSLKLPDWHIFAIGIGVVAVMAIICFAIPYIRHLVLGKAFPLIRRAGLGIGDVVRRPAKLAMLLGGSTIVTVSYITCLYLAGRAFGMTLGYAAVGAVYLAGSAVATAAPTPGGLGAVEAALIAGLVAAGVNKEIAVPAVFLFRFATFWLPIFPGWLSFQWLRKQDFI